MSRTCMVIGCPDGDYKINRWFKSVCSEHGCNHGHRQKCECDVQPCLKASCDCRQPFQLFNFPTLKARPEAHNKWVRAVNRSDPKKQGTLMRPQKSHRICSCHFIEGQPTEQHPDPTLNLGYENKMPKPRRVLQRKEALIPEETGSIVSEEGDNNSGSGSVHEESSRDLYSNLSEFTFCILLYLYQLICTVIIQNLLVQYIVKENKELHRKNISLNTEIEDLKQQVKDIKLEKQSHFNTIIQNDSDITFFTGFLNLELFNKIHNFVEPFVKRRWRGLKSVSIGGKRLFNRSPKKFGPARKLSSVDEFLLTLMKLRLGLLNRDLASRFKISTTLCSQIFHAWLTAMSKTVGEMVYWPDKEEIIATKPARYKHLPDLRAIIDCTEIFVETPKDLGLQYVTWSDYKHHNTLKFLIPVAPYSSITFISSCYGGRVSDQDITIKSGFLDKCDQYDMIQADKGFNINDACLAKFITLHVPPGKRGVAQMSSGAVNKTKRIANLRILVEQVIRRLKTFKILQQELPITLIPHVDKIIRVCAAIANTRNPIYTN